MKPTVNQIQTESRRYLKIVEWSDADKCYVGSAPPIVGRSGPGKTAAAVREQRHVLVEAWVAILLRAGKPLPPPTAGKTYSGKFLVRVPPDLHQKAALKAMARGESLNQFVAEALAKA